MADQVQIPESGGGEGAAPVAVPAQSGPEPSLEASIQLLKVETQAEVISQETTIVKEENLNEAAAATNPDARQDPLYIPQSALPDLHSDVKQEVVDETIPLISDIKIEENEVTGNVTAPKDQGDWQQREAELLQKIEELEKVNKERTQDSLLLDLKVREEEIDLLKARVKNLETELQAALSKPSGKNHEMIENIKQQHEELLSKARGMIFDKTKMVKNQELQIEALTTQIQSLKDINQITKDLLEIRNSEIKAMEDRLEAMEARFKAEKERYGLVLQRAQTSSSINDDLRKEYETQLVLFKELREKYDQRVQALVAENERLKGLANSANGGAGTSG